MKFLGSLRSRRAFVFWALAGLTHLVAHDAVWLAQVGPGAGLARALRQAGHGHWGLVSAVILAAALAAAVVVAARLWRLGHRARVANGSRPIARTGYRRRLAATWMRLAALVLVSFALQENAEHIISHGHLLGAGALAGIEYPLAIPVILGIAGLAATIAALVVSVERELLARIASARAFADRAPRLITRPPLRQPARRLAALVGADAGRAPPPLPVPT